MKEITRYLGIDTRAHFLAEQLWRLLEEPSGEIIASFYRDTRQSAIGQLLDEAAISRLQNKQKEHWRALFNSQFDKQYQLSATLIGIKHHEIGLDPKWYIAGYALMKLRFTEELQRAPLPLETKDAPSTWRFRFQPTPHGWSTSPGMYPAFQSRTFSPAPKRIFEDVTPNVFHIAARC